MTGSAFITSGTGWACSNDAIYDMQSTPIRGMDGKIISLHQSKVLKVLGLFGELQQDDAVDIAFKLDDTDAIMGFTGRVKSVGGLTLINILAENNNIKEILTKIT